MLFQTTMNRTRARLLLAASASVLTVAATGIAAQPIEQVVVTGTHIRGVAPVGSTVISVGAEDLEKTGVSNTTDLLMRVPQFVGIGSNEQTAVGGTRLAGAAGNTTFSRSLNLRNVGQEATLVLFNGIRHARNSLSDSSDIDVYPSALVERIEVVADGGSAIYGSDAVAGTVNIVLKSPRDEFESTFQAGIKNGSMDWLASQTAGVTWGEEESGIGDGGLMLVYAHSYTDPIDAADRPTLYNDDFTAYLPAPNGQLPVYSNPGNVRALVGGGGTAASLYAIPLGIGATTPLNLSQLGAANAPNRQSAWTRAFPLPRITRDTLAGVFEQRITDWLKFTAWGTYAKRDGAGSYGTRPYEGLNIAVPSTNPYSPCRVGAPPDTTHTPAITCPASGTITVNLSTVGIQGGTSNRTFSQKQHNIAGKFDIELPYEWTAAFTAVNGIDWGRGSVEPRYNPTALAQVVTGVGKPANVPFFNPFCDNSVTPCNANITRAYISSSSSNTNTNITNEYILGFNGPLFDLPGGTVRAAFGASHAKRSLRVLNYGTNGPAIGVSVIGNDTKTGETVRGVYGELYVPIVGAANAMPGVQALELTLAGRISDYSGFGSTQDPKIGFNWKPVDSLKLHGSWGTSFKAPNLRQNDPASAATLFVVNTLTCGQYGTTIASAGNCAPGGTGQISILSNTGGNQGLSPETAKTWSLGAEWTPENIDGLYVSLNYYNIDNKNRLTQNVRAAGDVGVTTASPLYDRYVIYNPTYFPTRAASNPTYSLGVLQGVPEASYNNRTQAEYDAFILALRGEYATQNTTPTTSQPAYFVDGRFANTGELKTDGIDYQVRYDFDLADWDATAHVGAGGTYVLSFAEAVVAGAVAPDTVNEFGSTLRYRIRAEAGFDVGGWSVTGYLNYSPSYSVDPIYLPATAPVQYQTVDSWTTFDLSVSYRTSEDIGVPLLRNLQFTVAAQNMFDNLPPLMLNGPGTNGVQFDTNFASAVGRYVSLRVSKAW